MTGVIKAIFWAGKASVLPEAVSEAMLEAGRGLVGDRYYSGKGRFSKKVHEPDSELTLIEIEEIDRFNAVENREFGPGEFRRNLVTQGVRLNDLVGHTFQIGAVLAEGMRLCEPCSHLAKLVSQTVVPGMVHRAGLRARIIQGGVVRIGDSIATDDGNASGATSV
jgi:MOSC domain-containing protein YiiM